MGQKNGTSIPHRRGKHGHNGTDQARRRYARNRDVRRRQGQYDGGAFGPVQQQTAAAGRQQTVHCTGRFYNNKRGEKN